MHSWVAIRWFLGHRQSVKGGFKSMDWTVVTACLYLVELQAEVTFSPVSLDLASPRHQMAPFS